MYQTQNIPQSKFTYENLEFLKNYFFSQNLSNPISVNYQNGDYQLLLYNNIYYLFNSTANTVALIIDGVNESKAIELVNTYLNNTYAI